MFYGHFQNMHFQNMHFQNAIIEPQNQQKTLFRCHHPPRKIVSGFGYIKVNSQHNYLSQCIIIYINVYRYIYGVQCSGSGFVPLQGSWILIAQPVRSRA